MNPPLDVNAACEWPQMMLTNKLFFIWKHENTITFDIWPIFLAIASKLLLALNVGTPCTFQTDTFCILQPKFTKGRFLRWKILATVKVLTVHALNSRMSISSRLPCKYKWPVNPFLFLQLWWCCVQKIHGHWICWHFKQTLTEIAKISVRMWFTLCF